MTRIFITTTVFDRRWSELGLSDEDLRKLEKFLMENPGFGDVIRGELIMDKSQSVFEDLMEALREVEEYQKGNITLRSNVVTVSDEEIEANQLLYQKIQKLPSAKKDRAVRYVDELLRA